MAAAYLAVPPVGGVEEYLPGPAGRFPPPPTSPAARGVATGRADRCGRRLCEGFGVPGRRRTRLAAAAAVLALLAGAACSGSPETGPVPSIPPPADTVARGVLVTPTGVTAPILARFDGGAWVRTPCFAIASVRGGTIVEHADVVIDPGHGGPETGAVAANGLDEKEPNLAVSREVERALEGDGTSVVLTHDADSYFLTIRTRAEIARALAPDLLLSVHHNAAGSAPRRGRPGSLAIHQAVSAPSRRLADLVYAEVVEALAHHDIEWEGGANATGSVFRDGENGDFYGMLRYAAGTPAVISEAAFMSNPPEADLLRTDAFRHEEAEALATAIRRYRANPLNAATDPGRPEVTMPPGPPTDAEGCVDPPLE